MKTPQRQVRVHLTNIAAAGPVQVVKSLLPALEINLEAHIDEIYLPDRGELAAYLRVTPGPRPRRYRRILPNVLSRALECTVLASRFDGLTPILVLGDIPLACNCRQVVFVQTAHMADGVPSSTWPAGIKNSIARRLFTLNSPRVSVFIVQTEVMRTLLETSYPWIRGKVVVIPQPPPSWLLESGLTRNGRRLPEAERLDLFYPAADHAHKNHALLGQIRETNAASWPVERLTLTIPVAANPNRRIDWIKCVGFLSPTEVLQVYGRTDAVVFLSKVESYGLPLVEAIHIGLPIVAPDLAYARTLCGDEAIYFDDGRIESLRTAIAELQRRLTHGWWPDWTRRRAAIPDSWSEVAKSIMRTLISGAQQRNTGG